MNEFAASEQLFNSIASFFVMDRPVIVQGIPSGSDDLGYTTMTKDHRALIAIARIHPIMDGLSKTEQLLFRKGVLAHEILHQRFTDFYATGQMAKSMELRKRELFNSVSNIFEDSRIEHFAYQIFGGEMLNALDFSINQVYLKSKKIESENTPLTQVMNAMIQFGDMGIIKGRFTYPEAARAFTQILPLFWKAIHQTNCKKALQLADEATDILLPLAPNTAELKEALKELIKQISSKAGSSTMRGTDANPEDSSSSEMDELLKEIMDELKDEHGDMSSETETDSSSDSGESKSTSSSPSKGHSSSPSSEAMSETCEEEDLFDFCDDDFDDGDTPSSKETPPKEEVARDAKKSNKTVSSEENDSDEIERMERINKKLGKIRPTHSMETDYSEEMMDLEKSIEEIQRKIDQEEQENKADTTPIQDAGSLGLITSLPIRNSRMTPSDLTQYLEFVGTVQPLIVRTVKGLEKIFKVNYDPEKTKMTNGKVNLDRLCNPAKKTPKVFDRRKSFTRRSLSVMVLVDESGSMSVSKSAAARAIAIILAESFAKMDVPCCIIGYSADEHYDNGTDLRHYTTWKNRLADRTSLLKLRGRRENRDGDTIRYATAMLKNEKTEHKLLIVLSDGQPLARDYYGKEAIKDTKLAIRDAKRNASVLGVLIGTSDTNVLYDMYGSDFLLANQINQLPNQLSKKVVELIGRMF